MANVVSDIREYGLELGFTQVGFAPAEMPASANALDRWLEAGMAADMHYLGRDPARRKDPRVYWPNARSIVATTLFYAAASPDRAANPLEGIIARYARGDDYHDVVKRRLHQLGHFVQAELPGTEYIAVVDTSALLERAHACRAGLGWIAKNGMLLSRQAGSFTVIGLLLLDRALPWDEPVPARCGTCRRCIDACPTGALVAPYVLDARRCVSYLTIEHRGMIPRDLRAGISNRVFGCDICQEVCPWVLKANVGPQPGPLAAKTGRSFIDLGEVGLESQEAFSIRWRKSPVKRSKRVGLARNIAVALGNSPDRERALAVLEALFEDPSPLVRQHVAWAIGNLGGPRAKESLEGKRCRTGVLEVQSEIEWALESL